MIVKFRGFITLPISLTIISIIFSIACTPQHIKEESNDAKVQSYLEKAKADDNDPLMWALFNNKIEAIELLIKSGCDINKQSEVGNIRHLGKFGGHTILHFVATSNNKRLIKYLIDNDANLNLQDGWGLTPLNMCSREGTAEMLKILIDAGSKIEIKDKKTRTALHNACRSDNFKKVAFLINAGAKINVKTRWGQTPLDYALEKNSESKIVKLLKKHGATTGDSD
ncbi:MAG: hypothetical protein COA79_21650 [Planctomycetota bacterium]|nr:MAG: hypothetical protein COA79_21650 [Planctomycetota bacterium]